MKFISSALKMTEVINYSCRKRYCQKALIMFFFRMNFIQDVKKVMFKNDEAHSTTLALKIFLPCF